VLNSRDGVFDRVLVDFAQRGGARVSWTLDHHFLAPPPYTFRLQVGATGNPLAADWADVGDPVAWGHAAVDPVRRNYALHPTTHYRVVVDYPGGSHTSRPAHVYGVLDKPNWLIAREIVRKEVLLQTKKGTRPSVPGLLLKRMREGATPDPANRAVAVTDPMTGQIIRTDRPATAGTEYTGGYFAPLPFRVTRISPPKGHLHRDGASRVGTEDAETIPCRLVVVPPVTEGDVFVATSSDLRYAIHAVDIVAEHGGVPLVSTCELRLVPSTSPIYDIPIARP